MSEDTAEKPHSSNINTGEETSSQSPTTTRQGYTRREKTILICTLVGQFFVNACVSLPAPFLPQIDETHGLNSDLTGWLLGISPLIQLLLSPFMGKFIPRVGLHTTFIFGFFFAAGATVLFGLLELLPALNGKSPEVEYTVIAFIIRSAQSVGQMAFVTAAFTLLSSAFTTKTTTIMSYSETVIGVGIMSGPAIGSAFFAVGGFMATFVGVGSIMLIICVAMYIALPTDIDGSDVQDEPTSVLSTLLNVNILYGLMMALFSAAIWASIDPILEPELRKKYGFTQELSALSFLLLSVTYSLTSPLVGRCLDKLRFVDTLSVGLFGYIIAAVNFVVMGPCPLLPWLERPQWLLLVNVGVMGLALGFTVVPSLDLVFSSGEASGKSDTQNNSSTTNTAIISGFYFSAISFGDFFGPTFSGIVTKESNFGWTMTYYAFGSIAVVFALLVLKLYRCSRGCRKRKDDRTVKSRHKQTTDEETKPLLRNV